MRFRRRDGIPGSKTAIANNNVNSKSISIEAYDEENVSCSTSPSQYMHTQTHVETHSISSCTHLLSLCLTYEVYNECFSMTIVRLGKVFRFTGFLSVFSFFSVARRKIEEEEKVWEKIGNGSSEL